MSWIWEGFMDSLVPRLSWVDSEEMNLRSIQNMLSMCKTLAMYKTVVKWSLPLKVSQGTKERRHELLMEFTKRNHRPVGQGCS